MLIYTDNEPAALCMSSREHICNEHSFCTLFLFWYNASGAYWCVFFSFSFFAFFVYMLPVCMFYGWPALLTFGFSGNLALYYLC